MSQQPPTIIDRLRQVLAPKTHEEHLEATQIIEDAEIERTKAEELFARLRGPGESHRPSWEGLAGVGAKQERRR